MKKSVIIWILFFVSLIVTTNCYAEWYLIIHSPVSFTGKPQRIKLPEHYSFDLLPQVPCTVLKTNFSRFGSTKYITESRSLFCQISKDTTVGIETACELNFTKDSYTDNTLLFIKNNKENYRATLICSGQDPFLDIP